MSDWPETIRRAFGIPDLVSPENVHRIIARRMLQAVPEPALQDTAPKPISGLTPFSDTFELAMRHVAALEPAASNGELDLPLCGFGTVIGPGPDVAEVHHSPIDAAVSAIREKLADVETRDAWIRWLFEGLESYVRTHPHPDD
jgi:hypothetical protein